MALWAGSQRQLAETFQFLFPAIVPNFFSAKQCLSRNISVTCFLSEKVQLAGIEPMTPGAELPRSTNYAVPTFNAILKKSKLWKKSGIFAELNLKWKVPAHFPNYFNVQKGGREKYLHMVVKINPV